MNRWDSFHYSRSNLGACLFGATSNYLISNCSVRKRIGKEQKKLDKNIYHKWSTFSAGRLRDRVGPRPDADVRMMRRSEQVAAETPRSAHDDERQ